nr:autophagy-related protein 18B isoform X2 [Ipomoea batatas]
MQLTIQDKSILSICAAFSSVGHILVRLIVILQEKTFIYDINSLKILDTIDTVPNSRGLCAFSPCLDGSFLALPASTTKGSVLVYNVMDLHLHCEIDAHRSPLTAMALSSRGMYIATASEQGTIVRVHLVSDATKSYSFRRGTCPSIIYSLSFAPMTGLPDIVLATSSSGSAHIFSLSNTLNQRTKRSSGLFASVIPDSVCDALDPAHHHVLHNAVSAGVKSNTLIRKTDKVSEPSTSGTVALRSDHISSCPFCFGALLDIYLLSICSSFFFFFSDTTHQLLSLFCFIYVTMLNRAVSLPTARYMTSSVNDEINNDRTDWSC